MAALRVNAKLAASDCTIVSTKMGQLTIASYAVKRAHSVWTPLHTVHSNSKAKKVTQKVKRAHSVWTPLLQHHCYSGTAQCTATARQTGMSWAAGTLLH